MQSPNLICFFNYYNYHSQLKILVGDVHAFVEFSFTAVTKKLKILKKMSSKFVYSTGVEQTECKQRLQRCNMSLPLPPRKVATLSANCWVWVVIDIKPKHSLAPVNLWVSTGLVTARFLFFPLYRYMNTNTIYLCRHILYV